MPRVIGGAVVAMIQSMEADAAVELWVAREQVANDDAQRFELMYRAHYAAIAAYAQRRLPGRADDVIAETFLVAWRRLDDVPSDALPWLYGVARRVVSDLRRSHRRQAAVKHRLALAHEEAPAEAPELDAELLSALGSLSERDQELLLLVYWEDLDPRRAARALACSRATIATRLWRAHRRLRTELERVGRRA